MLLKSVDGSKMGPIARKYHICEIIDFIRFVKIWAILFGTKLQLIPTSSDWDPFTNMDEL